MFLDFVADAHRQGFKVVLDGVFNHVGRAHPFFQDVLEKGKNSKYADWFEITDFGDEANWKKLEDPYTVHGKAGGIQWKAWDEVNGHLPAFKKDAEKGLAPGPYAHVMAITKRWLAPDGDPGRGIDGWRLDVANDIPHPFWRDWRKVVKSTKPDAYISGEIWSGAEPWINKGDQFDAVMNYQFAMPAQDFFVDVKTAIPPSVFAKQLANLCYRYPFQSALVMMNLFDSHDTDRFPSMFVNPTARTTGPTACRTIRCSSTARRTARASRTKSSARR
jgi:glycosidase